MNASSFSEEQMDSLYKVYAKIRLEQLNKLTNDDLDLDDGGDEDEIYYYLIEKMDDDQRQSTDFSKRYLDVSTAVGLASYIFSQLDVVTALSVVANLEKRAQYDPQFRTSFPGFLRKNSWFL